MVECNILEIEAALRGTVLEWSFKTDLPARTIMMVSCVRYYEDFKGRHFQWSIFQDRVFCQPISDELTGANGEIDVVSSEADAIREVMAISSKDWPGIRSIVDEALHLRCHVVPYQRERLADFGENNRDLFGSEVQRKEECGFVTKELSLRFPSNEYQRTATRRS